MSWDRDTIKKIVFAALDIAVNENGYTDLLTDDAAEVVLDIISCSDNLDEYETDADGFMLVLEDIVQEYQRSKV